MSTNNLTLSAKLNSRGIASAAALMGWQDHIYYEKKGYKYPVYDFSGQIVGQRWKNADSSAKPKYAWLEGSTAQSPYYCHPDIKQAIASANGVLYMVEGEPDLLTLLANGIFNVISPSSGVSSLPKSFADDLQALGVSWLIQFADNDDAGRGFAVTVRDRLVGSGISHDPRVLAAHKDINELWQALRFDSALFLAGLDTAPNLPLPAPQQPTERAKADQNAELPTDYISAIVGRLGVKSYRPAKDSGTWSNFVRCPIGNHEHDEKHPAAQWDKDKHILHCHKCERSYLAKEVAAALGIRKEDYQRRAIVRTPNLPAQPIEPISQLEVELYHFPNGIPDLLREVFLTFDKRVSGLEKIQDQANALVALELRNEAVLAGIIQPTDVITVTTLEKLGRNTSSNTIRLGLDQLEKFGFCSRQDVSNGKGRPTAHYTFKPLVEALATLRQKLAYREREATYRAAPDMVTTEWLEVIAPELLPEQQQTAVEALNQYRVGIYAEHAEQRQEAQQRYEFRLKTIAWQFSLEHLLTCNSTPIPTDTTWKNASEYRVSLYRAKAAQRQDKHQMITTRQAAAELGVTPGTLVTMRRKANIITDEIYDAIEVPQHKVDNILELAPRYAKSRKYAQCYLKSSNGKICPLSSKTEAYLQPQRLKAFAEQQHSAGASVQLMVLKGSVERQTTAEEIEAKRERLAAKRRIAAFTQRVEVEPRDKVASIEKAISDFIPDTFSKAYITEQLNKVAGWELIIDAVELGALITFEKDLFQDLTHYNDLPSFSVSKSKINTPDTPMRGAAAAYQVWKMRQEAGLAS